MPLQAKVFGYWVSDEPAAGLPGTRRYLAAQEPRVADPVAFTLAALVSVGCWAYFAGGIADAPVTSTPELVLVFILVFVAIASHLALIIVPVSAMTRRRSRAHLESRPWQAWPAKAEGRTTIDILDPEGKVFKTFQNDALMPKSVWRSMPDGLGVLWICGDLREPVFIAAPGGEQCWKAKAKPGPSGQSVDAANESLLEEVIRSAAAEWVKSWLGEHM
jgi:hypothetical protein